MFVALGDPAIYRFEGEPPESPERLRARFLKLESRRSPDGREQWLNWVVRLDGGAAIGYVQATVGPGANAAVAYVLASAYWGRGLARRAVAAMLAELTAHHAVTSFHAVAIRANVRSIHLLESLGFAAASQQMHARRNVVPSEVLMLRAASG